MSYQRDSIHGFDETVAAVEESAGNAGWVVLSTHNMKARFEAKGIEWHQGFSIVEVCKSGYASAMAAADPELALHLPCPVVVQEQADGGVRVSVLRPNFVAGLFPDTDFGDNADSAETEVRSIVDHATQ
jgi:uncharacterized protein (DUF302 family)